MGPQTTAQCVTLDAIKKIQSATGRSVLLREISGETGRSLATEWGYVRVLVKQGILARGTDGHGRGVQIVVENRRYQEGWAAAAKHIQGEMCPLLIQHHASTALTEALNDAILDAQNAATGG